MNFPEGGYVVVSADDCTDETIYGYSLTGNLDYDSLPKEIKSWFTKYSEAIVSLMNNDKKVALKTQNHISPVAPLLGNTEWHQMWPYNSLCPKIEGVNAPTGCVITAYAQLMKYYNWPPKGRKRHSYQWNGETLSVDFSKSEYLWDTMKGTYNENSDEESISAVAQLMRDLGVAYEADYNLSGTGAYNDTEPLSSYFRYASDTEWMVGDYVSSSFFESTIIDELNNKRPVVITGKASEADYHCFLCDGVDDRGYFHFNWGWRTSNGYYRLKDIPYSQFMDITYCIRPEGTATVSHPFYITLTNHFKYSKDRNKFRISKRRFGKHQPVRYCLALENTKSSEILYFNTFKILNEELYCEIDVCWDNVKNGSYILYPVYSILNGNLDLSDEWHKFEHNEKFQGYVEVNITDDDVKIFNPMVTDDIDEGTVEIDGVYYNLDKNKHIAKVTYRNHTYDSYFDDVDIPEFITYENEIYEVTEIGKGTFLHCHNLRSLTIPKSIVILNEDAIPITSLQLLRIPKDSKLEEIGSFGMEQNSNLRCLKLPDNLNTIGICAFQGCSQLKYLSIPKNYSITAKDPFHLCDGLQAIRFENSYPIDATIDFFGIEPDNLKVYVPMNSKQNYTDHSFWRRFVTYEYTDSDNLLFSQNSNDSFSVLDGDKACDKINIDSSFRKINQSQSANITHIGICAFFGNNDLTEIILPASLTNIGDLAFTDCENLESIVCNSMTPPLLEKSSIFFADNKWDYNNFEYREFLGVDKEKCVLSVPTGSKEKYLSTPGWNEFTTIVEHDNSEVDEIDSYRDVRISFSNGAIQIFNKKCIQTVNIYNLLGHLIYTGCESTITNLEKGFYIVKISNKTFKGYI
ncbi:MAG: C10 family peptidase [Muribaculaceae bacterium]|nr:C10 family peptidase [Muribaculaceae bacterium]